MNPDRSLFRNARARLLAPACIFFAASFASAQVATNLAPDAATLARYDKNKNGKLDPDELAAKAADDKKAASAAVASRGTESSGETVVLSPFEVASDKDNSYVASNTMSGTRLNSKLEDLGASITVVTKQQLLDTASIDINDIFLYEANTEGTGQFTSQDVNVNGLTTDSIQQSPQTSNRVRGIGAANMSVGGFEANSRIPVDTYNLDSVEISRGANSNMFGLGQASGTVNLNQGQGNLSRESSSFTLRGDNWGGFRSSVSLNRPIIKNKLAVRVDALYDSKGFTRKPSGDLQRRQYAALTYRPFSETSFKASAEFMTDRRQTPNSQTPRDTVSYWLQNGRPTWDPLTQTVHYPDGRPSISVGGTDALIPSGLGLDTTQYSRPSMYIENGKISLWTPNRSSTNGIPTNTGSNNRMIGTYTDIIRSRSTLYPLFTPVSVSDKSLYDWTDVNFASANWNEDKAATYNFSLDQKLFRTESQSSYAQVAWRREISSSYNHNTIRETSFLYVDINEKLLDGTINPYFRRPYLTVWDGSNPGRSVDDAEFVRAQLNYDLDLRHKSRWISWLGLQKAVGFYESKFTTSRSFNSRETMIEARPWMTAAQAASLSGLATGHASYKFYVGDNQGYNMEYGPEKSGFPTAKYNFHYLSVPATNTFVDEPILFGETPISASRNRTDRHTRGVNLQSFFLGDRLVTVLGYRKDDQRGRSTPGLVVHPDGLFYFDDLGNRGWNAWSQRGGNTKTTQTVLKPFRNWKFIDQKAEEPGFTGWLADTLRGVNLNYNKSDSFQPDSTPKKNLLGELLPDPNGQNRDYGFSVDMFHSKLTARVNWYKTEQKDARVTGGASTAVGRTQGLDTSFYTWANNVILTRPSMANATPDQIIAETYKLIGLPNGYLEQFNASGFAVSDVNDVTGSGAEYEINYNPSRNLRVKFTASRQQTIDSNLSNANQEYIDMRLPSWTTVKDDTGVLWWSTGPSNTYASNVVPVLKLARANLGKPRTQIKKWQWALTTNYSFGADSWIVTNGGEWARKLTGLSLGTALRWSDKSSIGFYGLPDADGIMRTYDINRPIYDPSRMTYDFNAGYNLRLFASKVRARIQFNVRDAFSHAGSLRAVSVNPDGTPANFRIVDGRQMILTTTFDL